MPRRLTMFFVFVALFSFSAQIGAQEAVQPGPKILDGKNESIVILRNYQQKIGQELHIVPKLTETQIIELSLQRAQLREKQSQHDADYIYDPTYNNVFKYEARIEKIRWKRTRDIIQRVVPGVDEDPTNLESLARQAASIEMVLRQEQSGEPNPKASALLDNVLLGTVPYLAVNASTSLAGNYSFVLLYDGLLTFLPRAAMSVVVSWQAVKGNPGSTFSLKPKPEDIDNVLKNNPYAQELLYKTLYSLLFEGSARGVNFDPPSYEYLVSWKMLKDHSERFIISHEYGHSLLDYLAPTGILPSELGSWQKEYRADYSAFFFETLSASEIDHLPPNVALQGGFFAISALDVIRKAMEVVRHGKVLEDKGTDTHPPNEKRIEFLKQLYLEQIGVGKKYKLPIKGKAGQNKTIDLNIEGALIASNTLNILWERIQPRFLKVHQEGILKLHKIWQQ